MIMIIIMFFAALLGLVLLFVIQFSSIRSLRTLRLFLKLPQAQGIPGFSRAWELSRIDLTDLPEYFENLIEKKSPIADQGLAFTLFLGYPVCLTNRAEHLEAIMSSVKHINKGPIYVFMKEWLNEGLLLSNGDKWKQRRKLLTPSFHFKILENNLDCLNRHWKGVAKTFLSFNGAPVNPRDILCRGTLEVIAETAMGVKLDEIEGSEGYVTAVQRSNLIIGKRGTNALYFSEFIFKSLPLGKEFTKHIKLLHKFTEKVIRQRRLANKDSIPEITKESVSEKKRKPPQAFLDTLIELDKEQKTLSDLDIREEVDTFMFEGHDTTASGLLFALFELGLNPDIQEKAYREQFDIFGSDDREVTTEDLTKMPYLEQVIKEVLRLYPPVPYMSRSLTEDVKLPNGMVIPAESTIDILPYLIHRNPLYYTDPNTFNPDRFSPEESFGRHPYAFIPFSAGPRNCIGQRFAMMEMKTALSTLLRFTKIKTLNKREDIKLLLVVILRPSQPILLEVTRRN